MLAYRVTPGMWCWNRVLNTETALCQGGASQGERSLPAKPWDRGHLGMLGGQKRGWWNWTLSWEPGRGLWMPSPAVDRASWTCCGAPSACLPVAQELWWWLSFPWLSDDSWLSVCYSFPGPGLHPAPLSHCHWVRMGWGGDWASYWRSMCDWGACSVETSASSPLHEYVYMGWFGSETSPKGQGHLKVTRSWGL